MTWGEQYDAGPLRRSFHHGILISEPQESRQQEPVALGAMPVPLQASDILGHQMMVFDHVPCTRLGMQVNPHLPAEFPSLPKPEGKRSTSLPMEAAIAS